MSAMCLLSYRLLYSLAVDNGNTHSVVTVEITRYASCSVELEVLLVRHVVDAAFKLISGDQATEPDMNTHQADFQCVQKALPSAFA
jgi:hypothetical protein